LQGAAGPTGATGPRGPQGPPLFIQDEGANFPLEPYLNFSGAGVNVYDDPANGRTTVVIPGGGSGGGISSPLVVKGDIWGFSTLDARIAVGADGQVLTADSTQTLGVSWVTPAAGGGGGAVSSVFGRTGSVAATAGDYTAAMVTNAVDQTQAYANPAWLTSLAWPKITGAPAPYALPVATTTILGGVKQGAGVTIAADGTLSVPAVTIPVTSVFGRTGGVVAAAGDYSAFYAASGTQVMAGAGLSGGGPLTGNVTLTANVQTVFGRTGAVVLTAADITGATGVLNTRQVLAGAGMSGGGPLTADVTLNALVTSVFGRTGSVAATAGDYTAAMVTNAADTTGAYANPSWITSLSWSKITGAPAIYVDPLTTKGDLVAHSTVTTRLAVGTDGQVLTADSTQAAGVRWGTLAAGGVTSFNTRTGAVVPVAGDYTAALVTNSVDSTQAYANPAWITSLAYSKITGAPTMGPQWSAGSGGAIYYNSGNVGIGTASPQVLLDLPYGNPLVRCGSMEFGSSSLNNSYVSDNLYYNGSAWTYRNTGYGLLMQCYQGGFSIYTAPSGTAATATTPTWRMQISNAGQVVLQPGTGSLNPRFLIQGGGPDAHQYAVISSANGGALSAWRASTVNNVIAELGAYGPDNGVWFYGRTGTSTAPAYMKLGATDSTFPIQFMQNGAEVVRIAANGNVGIGSTSPAYKLEVANTGGPNSSTFHLTSDGTDTGAYFFASANANWSCGGALISGSWVAKATGAVNISLVQSAGAITFSLDSGLTVGNSFTPTERMRITSAGNVGIGSASPNAQLAIGLISPNPANLLTYPNIDQANFNFYASPGFGNYQRVLDIMAGGGNAGGSIRFLTQPAGAAANAVMMIGPTGNVGIGTTNPAAALDCAGMIRSTAVAAPTSGAGTEIFYQPTGPRGGIQAYDRSAGAYKQFNLDGNPLIINVGSFANVQLCPSGGNVGIGTASPAYLLHLNGGAYCNGTAWTNASDVAVKYGFTPIDPNALLTKLESLPIQDWSYNVEGQVRHVGPTGQDFLRIFNYGADPCAISTVDGIGVALAAAQGLLARLQAIEAQLGITPSQRSN
jgi:hypothetical protein